MILARTAAPLLAIAIFCACPEPGSDSTAAPSTPRAEPTYHIDGVTIRLGALDESGTVSLLTVADSDMNGDGRADRGAVLVQNSRGSGVFYYLNVFLDDGSGAWRHAGEAFLGDRIKLDFIDIYEPGSVSRVSGVPIHPSDHGQLVVGFFTHGRDQPFAAEPELYLTRQLTLLICSPGRRRPGAAPTRRS